MAIEGTIHPYSVGPADRQMERDLELLSRAAREEIIFRLYGWDPPAVTAGRNTVVSPGDLDRWRSLGLDFARRPSGGGMVRHGDDMAFAFAAGRGILGDGLKSMYRRINSVLLEGLVSLGVPAELSAGCGKGRSPVCFSEAIEAEIMLGGAKIVGSAMLWKRDSFLCHGSIVMRRNRKLDEEALGSSPGASIEEYLGRRVIPSKVLEVMRSSLENEFDISFGYSSRLEEAV